MPNKLILSCVDYIIDVMHDPGIEDIEKPLIITHALKTLIIKCVKGLLGEE